MRNEVDELSIDELDTVSGGLSTATVVAGLAAGQRFFQYEVQRFFGSRGASSVPVL